jgi:hypothetical protein
VVPPRNDHNRWDSPRFPSIGLSQEKREFFRDFRLAGARRSWPRGKSRGRAAEGVRFTSETGPKHSEKGPDYPEISPGISPAGHRSDHGATRPEIPRQKSSPNSYDTKIRRSDRPVNSRIGITPRGAGCRANARVNTTTPTTPPSSPPPARAPARAPILLAGALLVLALLAAQAHGLGRLFLRRRAGDHGPSDDPAALAADGRVAPAGGGRVDRERTPRAESVHRAQLRGGRHGGLE